MGKDQGSAGGDLTPIFSWLAGLLITAKGGIPHDASPSSRSRLECAAVGELGRPHRPTHQGRHRTCPASTQPSATRLPNAGHTVAMKIELAGDGAHRPAFGVVVAQDLRFSFGGKGQVCSCRDGFGESDRAGSPGVPSPARDDGNDSTARAPKSPA